MRHFIKIQFVNKGIEVINLPSVSKDKSVISSIPAFLENKDYSIICYKYNEPIRRTVFEYNKLLTELDIENSVPDSCDFKDSKYHYQPAGDLKIITDL